MLYKLGWLLFRFLFCVFRRWEVRGLENFPVAGPVVVAANHVSYLDPIVLGCALPRQVFFMAKKELFRYPLLGPLLRRLGAFPVDRERADRQAVRKALEILKEGRVLGIFPEGRRSRTGEILPPYAGAAYFAARAGVPVCPVALEGTTKLFGKLRVTVGAPFFLGEGDPAEGARLIMEKIKSLLEQGRNPCFRAEK